MTDDYMAPRSLGDRIKDRRARLNVSRKALSRAVGVSDVTVLYWETGEIEQIGHERLLALAWALECTLSELVEDPALPALIAEQQARLLDWALEDVAPAALRGKLLAERERLRALADHRPVAWPLREEA